MRLSARKRRSGEVNVVVVPRERESGIRLRDERGDGSDDHRRIAEAAQSASLGFDVCARRAGTKELAERMTWLAGEARAIAESAAAKVPGGVRRPTTSERMRWEWLASVGGRVAEESGRHLAIAEELATSLAEEDLVDRIERLAATSRAVAA